MTLKLVFTAFLLEFGIKGTVWRASLLALPLRRALGVFPHRGEVDSWLATPRRDRYGALIAFS